MTDALDRLTTLRSEMERKHKEMQEVAKEALKDGTRAIFEEYGDILAKFGWAQYTPYFNDGDPCEFGMNELVLVGKKSDDGPDDDEREEYEDEIRGDLPYDSVGAFSTYSDNSKISDRYGTKDERYVRCHGACLQVYEALAYGDLAKELFGDHVQVIITPESVETTEYDHE